jgi:RNA methyltransferase, TrmH family
VFLVEGHRQVACALEAGIDLDAVYAAPSLFLGERDHELIAVAERRGVHVVELGAAAFRSVSGAARPDGLLAVARRWPTTLPSLEPGAASLLLVAEGLERPGNLGTIVRSACSAGATGLLACDTPTDVFHPGVVRGSVGTLFRLPVATCTAQQALPWLREHGVRIVVATPGAERRCWDAPLTGPVALVVGSERHGVSARWLAAADERVSIPMPGPADSLNVAVAAGIVLFEAVRQRGAGCGPP